VTLYDNATGTRRRTPLLYLPLSTTISNRKCRCVQHRHPERPTGVEGSVSSLCSTPPTLSPSNRKSGIRNPRNRRTFNHFHFSNRKYSAIFLEHRAPNLQPPRSLGAIRRANRDAAIKTPDKPRHFNHFQFSNRDKTQVLHPERISGSASFSASLPPRFSLSKSLCLRASVANLCDNGWLKLRLM
jgi:hypothetical protein